MSKKKDKTGKGPDKGNGPRIPKHIAGFKLPKDLRKTGEALIAQATSPAGQAVLAKGLTMAAGFANMAVARNAQAARSAQAGAAPKPAESAEGVVPPSPAPPPPPPPPPLDPAKIVETVNTVADAVLGRLFPKR